MVAYQHLPVFHTEHCVFCRFLSTGTSYRDCGRPCEKHRVELQDSSGRAHPVLADVGCRNTVFGAEAQEASRHLEAWKRAGIRHFRLEFVHESAEEVKEVARVFAAALAGENHAAAAWQRAEKVRAARDDGGKFVHSRRLFETADFAMIDKVGLLTIRDGRVLLCRKKRGTSLLILPGGKREAGESSLECLARELREELGDVVAVAPELVGVYMHAAAGAKGKIVRIELYRAELDGRGARAVGDRGAGLVSARRRSERCWRRVWRS